MLQMLVESMRNFRCPHTQMKVKNASYMSFRNISAGYRRKDSITTLTIQTIFIHNL